MSRLFDQFSRSWLGLASPGWDAGWGLDVREEDGNVIVRAEAPGFEPSDFDIQVRGDQLVLSATHRSESQEKREATRNGGARNSTDRSHCPRPSIGTRSRQSIVRASSP